MIHITSGHPKGIGLETLIKSLFLFSKDQLQNMKLYTSKEALEETLRSLNIRNIDIDINIEYLESDNVALDSLEAALKAVKDNDILVTLPTSKDTLSHNGILTKGYTEYFRSRFDDNFSMCFLDDDSLNLLVTDHMPLKEVASSISSKLINNKVNKVLKFAKDINFEISEVLISGLNPHAGENGLLGDEESIIHDFISLNKDLPIKGPIPADTIFNSYKPQQLRVFMYHDQGLTLFKQKNKFKGINVTCGLPFIRFSVDHGTAFEIFGKNKANPMGMHYVLNKALEIISYEK
ncbi:MAG: hypothetical protein GY909_11750 [Oligoflexia bacterium]|nr:hypothetical protein [Oligoflexia bacterium]